jgi:glycosyltransferase involved in cell wall biosynthesis
MFRQPQQLIKQNPGLSIDIYTRYQDNDFQIDKSDSGFLGKEILHDRKSKIHAKELSRGNIRIIRLPAGPTDRYILKEDLYGKFIDQFMENIYAFSKERGISYSLAHGHYADGWEVVTKLSKLVKSKDNIDLPTILTTHSLGKRKRKDCIERKEDTVKNLDKKYNFPTRITSEEKSLDYASVICPLSSTEKEFLENHYDTVKKNDSRLRVTPNGINPNDFKKANTKAVRNLEKKLETKDSFSVLVPSRVDARKGQLNLLKALDKLGTDYLSKNNIKVILVAWPEKENKYTDILNSYIKGHKLKPFIIKRPSIPHEKMPIYFGAADLVAIPSQEYFSIAMIEAMLLEKPLIASKEGGSRDAIVDGESGILVDHNDFEDIAKALKQVINMTDNKRSQMGSRARKRILNNYTLTAVAKKIDKIYLGLLS